MGRSPEVSRTVTFSRATVFYWLNIYTKLLPDKVGGASH